jgi:hypothetical protein
MHAPTPRLYIFQALFQHEVFVITPTLNAGSRCLRHVSHALGGNTIIVFLIFCTKLQKINETLLNTELSISKIYKVAIFFGFLYGLYFNVKFNTKLFSNLNLKT